MSARSGRSGDEAGRAARERAQNRTGDPADTAALLAMLGLGAQGGEEIVPASGVRRAEVALGRPAEPDAEGLDELSETV